MGLEIDRHEFSDAEFARFVERLRENVAALERLLARPGFGVGAASIGAELELNLIDAHGRPLPINTTVLAGTAPSELQLECDRFNVEIATSPQPLAGRPFTALGGELDRLLSALRDGAAQYGARLAVIGILPTLRTEDLSTNALTATPRFRALSAGLKRLRQAPFQVAISGDDTLHFTCDDVTLEGATTSWQVHLRVPPADFARTYNACQIATAPVLGELSDGTLRFLALAGALLGHRLPTFLALNEPETSLHPDHTPALARLIILAARRSQVWIVTHSRDLAQAIERTDGARPMTVVKRRGETGIDGSVSTGRPNGAVSERDPAASAR